MKEYFVAAMIGVNVMLIWFGGILLTDYESRLRVLEYHQAGMEDSQAHAVARMEKATRDMVTEVKRVMDIP